MLSVSIILMFDIHMVMVLTSFCFLLVKTAINSLYDLFFFHMLPLIQQRGTRLQMLLMARTLGGRVPVLRMELNTIMLQLRWIYSRYSTSFYLLILSFSCLKLYLHLLFVYLLILG